MERSLHLVDPPVTQLRWPSIAEASLELRRPRRLHPVAPHGATAGPRAGLTRPGTVTQLDARRR